MPKNTESTAVSKSFNFAELWGNIKPPVTLMLISLITCGMLIFVHNATYVDTTGIITDELQTAAEKVIGSGNYHMLTNLNVDGVTSIIVDNETQSAAFEIIANGYTKAGLHLLIGINKDGQVSGVEVISVHDTPGLGTKVNDQNFLDKFNGLDSPDFDVDNITGATYSSKGVKSAVSLAIQTYQNEKEAIFSE